MPTSQTSGLLGMGFIDIRHSTKSLVLSTKSGYVRVLFKWCKSGVTYKIPASSKWSESLENTGFFAPIRGVKCISSAFRYTQPPLSFQNFSNPCAATVSRFLHFSYLLISWRIFSLKWCKNWCKTDCPFILHHKNPETVGAVRLRGFERGDVRGFESSCYVLPNATLHRHRYYALQ